MGATCVPPGGSEYYQELLADGWLEEEDSKPCVDMRGECEGRRLIWVLQMIIVHQEEWKRKRKQAR